MSHTGCSTAFSSTCLPICRLVRAPSGCFPVLDQCPHNPGLLCAQEYGTEADLWSVGMLTYQLLTGRFPFWDNVQNLTLQQARAVTSSCNPRLLNHSPLILDANASRHKQGGRLCVSRFVHDAIGAQCHHAAQRQACALSPMRMMLCYDVWRAAVVNLKGICLQDHHIDVK